MKYVFALLILVSMGCQQQSSYRVQTLGEPADFSVLVNQMNSDLAKIGYPPIPNNINYYAWNEQGFSATYNLDGLCSRDSDGNVAVSLNVDVNDLGVSDYVMFVHEIGHCVYGKHHVEGEINIMNSVKSADIRTMFYDEPTRLQMIKEMIEN